jgi:hypothetical protein
MNHSASQLRLIRSRSQAEDLGITFPAPGIDVWIVVIAR